MTANQINYQRMRTERAAFEEDRRHNLETERVADLTLGETARSNVARESETVRHNRATESQALLSHSENVRHNLATEQLGRDTLSENTRHNKAGESETQRHNIAQERETSRHNLSQESIGYAGVQETARHNAKMEQESSLNRMMQNWYYNETIRVNEKYNDDRIEVQNKQIDKNELIAGDQLAETQRHNYEMEKHEAISHGSEYLRALGPIGSAVLGAVFG